MVVVELKERGVDREALLATLDNYLRSYRDRGLATEENTVTEIPEGMVGWC
jgi:hypothetical protein